MVHPVVVIREGLAGVEGRVNVDEFDLAPVLLAKFRSFGEHTQHVEAVASEEEIVGIRVVGYVPDGHCEIGEPDFRSGGMVTLNPYWLAGIIFG